MSKQRSALILFTCIMNCSTLLASAPELFTNDIRSAAGQAYEQACTSYGHGDERKQGLIQAAQMQPAFYEAARVLHRDYPGPDTRRILIDSMARKVNGGYVNLLTEDLCLLGHHLLGLGGCRLQDLFRHIQEVAADEKKPKLFYYLYGSSWRELSPMIPDYDKAAEIATASRAALVTLSNNNNHRAHIYLGLIAMQEGNLERSYGHLLNAPLVETLKSSINEYHSMDPDWQQGMSQLIERYTHQDQTKLMNLRQTLGALYKTGLIFDEAFSQYFAAYKLAFQFKAPEAVTLPVFAACKECAEATAPASDKEAKRKNGAYRFNGYQLHQYRAEEAEKAGATAQAEQERVVARGFLRQSLVEGNTDLLGKVLAEGSTMFVNARGLALFLHELVHEEWDKSKKSTYFHLSTEYKMFAGLGLSNTLQIQAKLRELFLSPDADEQLKTMTALSLLKLNDKDIAYLAKNREIEYAQSYEGAIQFLNQKDLIKFTRSLRVDSNYHYWLQGIQDNLRTIFQSGVVEKEYDDNVYWSHRRLISTRTLVKSDASY